MDRNAVSSSDGNGVGIFRAVPLCRARGRSQVLESDGHRMIAWRPESASYGWSIPGPPHQMALVHLTCTSGLTVVGVRLDLGGLGREPDLAADLEVELR